jgi:hypothetical protein
VPIDTPPIMGSAWRLLDGVFAGWGDAALFEPSTRVTCP